MSFSIVEEMFKVPEVPKAADSKVRSSSQKKGRKRKYSIISGDEHFLGELIYHQADPDALKCLIAANMAGCLLEKGALKTSRGVKIKTKMVPYFRGRKSPFILRLKLKENGEHDANILQLKNPFTISWIIHRLSEDQFEKQTEGYPNVNGTRSRTNSISSNSHGRARTISSSSNTQERPRTFSSTTEYFPFSDIVQAQIMQWNDFSCSEIKPFISAIMTSARLDPTKATKQENAKLKTRLSEALDVLNEVLEKKSFLMGNRCTLADIFVAVDLIPIMEAELTSNWPALMTLQKSFEKEHHVYLKKWFSSVLLMPFASPIRKKIRCYLPPEVQNQATPNAKGDINVKDQKKPVKSMLSNKNQKGQGEVSSKMLKKRQIKEKEKLDKEAADVAKKLKEKEKIDKEAAAVAKKNSALANYQLAKEELSSLENLPPLKVLALHDYRQNDEMFSRMVEPFKKIVGDNIKFTYISAPNIPLAKGDDDIYNNLRGWWFTNNSNYYDINDTSDFCKGFESSIDTLVDIVKAQGPFDGIMGFSQGAALAAMICLDSAVKKALAKFNDTESEGIQYQPQFPAELSSFKFAILFSGYCSKSSTHSKIYDKVREIRKLGKSNYLNDSMVPILNVIGDNSRIVRGLKGEKLSLVFGLKNTQEVHYDRGHYIPKGGINQQAGYFNFISRMKKICYGELEQISANMQNLSVGKSVDDENEPNVKKNHNVDVDSEGAEFASPLLQSPSKEIDEENNRAKPGEGADHPVIRAIQNI